MNFLAPRRRTRILLALLSTLLVVFFATCHKNGQGSVPVPHRDSLSFLVVGDWGKDGAGFQRAVADQMNVIGQKFHAQFIITTGDNFYNYGVAGVTDPHWKASFEDVYNGPGHQVPWYPTLGNHDYGLNPQAQIDYSAVSSRWKMPARYYKIEKNIDSSHTVLFVFTDTSPFVKEYYSYTMSDLKKQDTTAQVKWLHQTLAASTSTWKIVVGHHPLYSVGLHGNTPELIRNFKPELLQFKSDFYLSGHDHSMQYHLLPGEPVHYLLSAGGSETYAVGNSPNTPFAAASPGFVVVTLYTTEATVYYYDQNGNLLFSTTVKK